VADEPYNAAERRHVKQAAKAAKLVTLQRGQFITNIMSTLPGRAWVCDLLEAAHVFASTYSDIALRTAFGEGERSMGLRILADIMQACPDQYVTMMRERNERSTTEQSRRPAATAADSTAGAPEGTSDDGADDDGDEDDDIYAEYNRAQVVIEPGTQDRST